MAYTPEPSHFVALADLCVNHRYLHASKSGHVPVTVRAILPSASSSTLAGSSSSAARGDLVGIEYDDPTLGRHSGTLDGRKVFQIRIEGAGSFVKYDDARRKGLYRGWTLVEALMERYGVDIPLRRTAQSDTVTAANPSGGVAGTPVEDARLANGREIEMPNMDGVARRVARLNKLQHAGLEGYCISSLALPDQVDEELKAYLRANLTSLTSLDISGNLMHDWTVVREVVNCTSALQQINLSHSRIKLPHGNLPEQSIPNVQVVMLNSCDISSNDLVPLTYLLPDLVRLDMPNNPRVTKIHALKDATRICAQEALVTGTESLASAKAWRGLKYLNIASTGLAAWGDVLPVFELCPSLETLDLSGTPISSIPPLPFTSASGQPHTIQLPGLIWNDSCLTSWSSVDNLRAWTGASLTSLRCSFLPSGTPATTTHPASQSGAASDTLSGTGRDPRTIGADEALNRALLIASLPSLTTLNGTAITSTERKEAEMAYVRHIQANGSDAGMREPWGMYTELARKHGLDQEMGSRGSLGVSEAGGSRAGAAISGAGALKSRLITLTIHCPLLSPGHFDQSPNGAAQKAQISILPSTSIPLLRKKLAKLLCFPTAAGMRVYTVRTVDACRGAESSATVDGTTTRDAINGAELEQAIEVEGENVGYWFVDGDILWVDA